MSADDPQYSARLPPIGFEQIEEEVKPLKKKKKKKSKLKHIALATQGLTQGAESSRARRSSHKSSLPHIDEHPDQRLVSSPSLPRDQPDGRLPPPEQEHVKLRHKPGAPRTSSKRKRFTVADLDTEEPEWLRKKTIGVGLDGQQKKMVLGNNTRVRDRPTADLLRKLYNAPERDRIDYVMTYKIPFDPNSKDEIRKGKKRQKFEAMLESEGFLLEHEDIEDTMYCKLHCTFPRLCKEAEMVKLQMPIKNMEIAEDENENCCTRCIDSNFVTDNEVDFVSAPFEQAKLHLYENCENPDLFFRSSLRALLTDHILTNLDMRKLTQSPQYYYHNDDGDDPEEDILSKQGLPYLLMKKVYEDAFILHDESADDHKESEKFSEDKNKHDDNRPDSAAVKSEDEARAKLSKVLDVYGDARHDLNVTWPKVTKFQPLWKIRNYFGEEIALYFALIGLFISSIILPMFIGLGVFGYGLFCSISKQCGGDGNSTASTASTTTIALTTTIAPNTTNSGISQIVNTALSILDIVKEAFDNDTTPWYAITICIWSTIFLELWKRKNAVLAYEWDVDDFDDVEPDRPEYFGTATMKDPITHEEVPFYPFKYKCYKYTISFITFLVCVCVVAIILMSVITYRVAININYCPDWDEESTVYCFLVTTVCSSILNAIVIVILGKIYEILAHKLTDWENHRTLSQYRNALITKLFAFQFANCYASLYYIAFFRNFDYANGILGLGEEYMDRCSGDSCMSELSFQVFVLMIIKPLPRFLKDVILPWLKKLLKSCCKKKSSTIDPDRPVEGGNPGVNSEKSKFLINEKNKPVLKEFTLNEYMEKILQYGFIVLFAAAMPLGPLIAVLVNALDRFIDSKRLLWMYRRPLGNIAQDIGMWMPILEFMSIVGVITNAFIIAYVSDWGKDYFRDGNAGDPLWAVLAFEHAVFIIKYVLAVAIPDVPHRIRIAMRKEKFTVAKILETGMFVKDLHENSPPADAHNMAARQTPEGERRGDRSDVITARNVEVDTTRHRGPSPMIATPPAPHENYASNQFNRQGAPKVELDYGANGEVSFR